MASGGSGGVGAAPKMFDVGAAPNIFGPQGGCRLVVHGEVDVMGLGGGSGGKIGRGTEDDCGVDL